MTDFVKDVMNYAFKCHANTNHFYDGKPYSVHLEMVYNYAEKYKHLIKDFDPDYALAASFAHDTMEDTRQTYNDVKKNCGEFVAEIVYALTNDKGKTRIERAGIKYYYEIRKIPLARYVKICDRLANTNYSKETGSKMFNVYRKEYLDFKIQLYYDDYKEMFEELEMLYEI